MLEEFYQSSSAENWQAFRSDGYLARAQVRHPNGTQVPMENLPPLLRTLLVTDGTVTKVLEAYFWEPVNVNALHLDVEQAQQRIPWLNAEAWEPLLLRRVELKGERSQNLYAKAFSVVKLAEFDDHLQQALVQGRVGIGVLLRESGLETYREIMTVGMEYGSGGDSRDIWIHRTYRIVREQKPVILIRESFPWCLYQTD